MDIQVIEDRIGQEQLESCIRANTLHGAANMIMRTLHHETHELKICRKTGKDKFGNAAKLTIDPAKIDLKALASCFMSEKNYRENERMALAGQFGESHGSFVPVEETTDNMQISDPFGPIGGQIIFAEIGQSLMEESAVADQLVTERPSLFRSEKIPWLTDYPDDGEAGAERLPGEDFKAIGFTNEFITTPDTVEFGRRILVSRRDVFFNRIGGPDGVIARARAIGRVIARIKEDAILKGGPLGQTLYQWTSRQAAGLAPYAQAFAGQIDWINELAPNVLATKDQLRNLNHLFDKMVDPNSGRNIEITPTDLLVTGTLMDTASDVIRTTDTEDRTVVGGRTVIQRRTGTGLRAPVTLYKSNRLFQLGQDLKLGTAAELAELYWYGVFKEAWGWMSNWGLETAQYGGRNTQAFVRNGTMLEVSASLMGTFFWRQNGPRWVTRSFNTLTPQP